MPRQAPNLAAYRASADTPITAGAWNALRGAILDAYTAADALATRQGYIIVTVRERASDAPLPSAQIARVAAQPEGVADSDLPAVRLGARYFIGPLDPGVYRVAVAPAEISGFTPQIRPVSVISGQPAEITVFLASPAPGRVGVPALFGQSLQQALRLLGEAGLRPGRVIDSHGGAVIVTDAGRLGGFFVPDQALAAAPVVVSEPGAHVEVDQGSAVSLLVAAGRIVPPEDRLGLIGI
jgi:hypothetical protein